MLARENILNANTLMRIYMKDHFIRLCIAALLLTVLSACRKEGNDLLPSLNEKEHYSASTLASVSDVDGRYCFIGTAGGDIYRYDKQAAQFTDTLRTRQDHIYHVAQWATSAETKYIVSVRNTGLMVCRAEGGELVPERCFAIHGRWQNYSPYKAILCGDRMYAVTSHGLFYKNLSDAGDNVLERLYPAAETDSLTPFPMVSMVECGGCLYAASPSGVVTCDMGTNRVGVLCPGSNIRSLAVADGCVRALSPDTLYTVAPQGQSLRQKPVPMADAAIYSYALGTHYFIYNDRVTVAHGEDWDDGGKCVTIPLRRSLKPEYRNIVLADSTSMHTLMVTENALFRIPFHLDLFNADGRITAACSSADGIYFVANNSLFSLRAGDGEAQRIADLPEEDRVTSIVYSDGAVYYTNGNSEVKCKHLAKSYLCNEAMGAPKVVYRNPSGIVALGTAADSIIHIGVRDTLLTLRGKTVEAVRAYTDPYVTRFAINGGKTYAALLNGGVLRLQGQQSSAVAGSARHHFIRDVAFAEFSGEPCILTNRHIFSPGGKDSVEARGFSRLLSADGRNFYALMENGVGKYHIGSDGIRHLGDTLCDIRFNPAISFVSDSSVYVGATSLGVLELRPDGTSRWVTFNHDVYKPDLRFILPLSAIAILLAGFVLWYRRRRESDLGTYSEWESVRHGLRRINSELVKEVEKEELDSADAVDRRLTAGKAWLARYETLKCKAERYMNLTKLEVFGPVFINSSLNLGNSIRMLCNGMRRRGVDIQAYEELCQTIERDIAKANACDMTEELLERCTKVKKTMADIAGDFMAELNHFAEECHEPCADAECAIGRLQRLNAKWMLMRAVECIANIRNAAEQAKDRCETLCKKDGSANPRAEQKRNAEHYKAIADNMTELYYILSQNTILAKQIGIKKGVQRDDIFMSHREKVLMLLIAVPEIQPELVHNMLKFDELTNTRSTISKVKGKLTSINDNDKREIYSQPDSLGKYIVERLCKKR